MRTTGSPSARVYTLSIASTPILLFEATNYAEARQLSKEAWLIEELRELTREGKIDWPEGGQLSVVRSTSMQEEIYYKTIADKPPTDDLDLVYLIPAQ